MRSELQAMSSRPSKRIEPDRRSTIPMIDLSVVVLPAPLRPSSVTTSPSRTSKPTPCNTCDSPYQASSPATCSSGSAMRGAEIGGLHVRVLRHGRIVALGEHAPARQHRDAIGQMLHYVEIVLHHQHRAVDRNAPDQ